MSESYGKSKKNELSPNARSKYDHSYYKQLIAEQKKEIVRLQKQLAKAEVKFQSGVAKVRAQEFEKYSRKCLQITRDMSPEEASRLYREFMKASKGDPS